MKDLFKRSSVSNIVYGVACHMFGIICVKSVFCRKGWENNIKMLLFAKYFILMCSVWIKTSNFVALTKYNTLLWTITTLA